MKLPLAASIAVVTLTCIASAMGAGGQVVDHGKVVEDPQLDYRKYNKEITAGQAADDLRQAAELSAAQQSAGRDEAAFRASLAATAFSLNDGAAAHPDTAPSATTADDTSAAPAPIAADTPHGLSIGVLIAIGVSLIAALVAIGLALSSKRRRKSRHRKSRRHQPQEDAVRLVDFARKTGSDKSGE